MQNQAAPPIPGFKVIHSNHHYYYQCNNSIIVDGQKCTCLYKFRSDRRNQNRHIHRCIFNIPLKKTK